MGHGAQYDIDDPAWFISAIADIMLVDEAVSLLLAV